MLKTHFCCFYGLFSLIITQWYAILFVQYLKEENTCVHFHESVVNCRELVVCACVCVCVCVSMRTSLIQTLK